MISPNSNILAPATARFPFGSPSPAPPQAPPPPPPPSETFSASFEGASSSPAGLAKKKRGRPRKYSPDGNIALGLAPTQAAPAPSAGDSGSADAPPKKHRGRPPGSGKKQLDALGAGGLGFTPHVIIVETGEDIIEKLVAFSQQGPRTVCILSASGAIRDVILRIPQSAATHTYEGPYAIISLTGALEPSESYGGRTRPRNLRISMAGADGRVSGGEVAGTLTAAEPVQIIVGSFIVDGKKSSSNVVRSGPSPSSAPTSQMLAFGAPVTPTSPPTSQGPSTESSEDNDQSSFNRGPGLYNNATQPVHSMQMYHHPLWAGQTHH